MMYCNTISSSTCSKTIICTRARTRAHTRTESLGRRAQDSAGWGGVGARGDASESRRQAAQGRRGIVWHTLARPKGTSTGMRRHTSASNSTGTITRTRGWVFRTCSTIPSSTSTEGRGGRGQAQGVGEWGRGRVGLLAERHVCSERGRRHLLRRSKNGSRGAFPDGGCGVW